MEQEQDSSLRDTFSAAKANRKNFESFTSSADPIYQENLRSAIEVLEQCRRIAGRISLFSPNEILEDVSSADIQYFLIDYYLGELLLKDSSSNRKQVLRRAQEAYEQYLLMLDTYRVLSRDDNKLYERYIEDRDGFSLMQSNDPGTRRDVKIARFRKEKELTEKLEHLAQNPGTLKQEEAAIRDLYLAEIDLSTHNTFHALDMIAQELKLLAMMPPTPPAGPEQREADYREHNGPRKNEYSERLDPSLSQLWRNGRTGPLLNKEGKPLQPFTLLDSRQRLQTGVFKPDHTLPTMTIDEYLAEEKRRGGIIEGGGEQSGRVADINEDDVERADAETMKAREWDEFTEANPKGCGNTINRG